MVSPGGFCVAVFALGSPTALAATQGVDGWCSRQNWATAGNWDAVRGGTARSGLPDGCRDYYPLGSIDELKFAGDATLTLKDDTNVLIWSRSSRSRP